MAAEIYIFISAAILDFLKNLLPTKFASYQHHMNAKRRFDFCLDTLGIIVKKTDSDPPFWIEPPFLSDPTQYVLDPCY
jgi:hypothetical protein